MFTILKGMVQAAFFLAFFTVVGQFRLGERSLENRYHLAVNSERFQTFFWTTVRPVTWTWEKARDLANNTRSGLSKESAR